MIGSQFVGVVECIQAGGIVAKYRVVESWQGAPVGSEFTLHIPVDYWEPQFPTSMCERKYLVIAVKSSITQMLSYSGGGLVPLWWRQIPADFTTFPSQGIAEYPMSTLMLERAFGSHHGSLEEFRQAVQDLSRLSPADRELLKFKVSARTYLSPSASKITKRMLRQVEQAKTVKQAVEGLLKLASDDESKNKAWLLLIIAKGPETARLFNENPARWNVLGDEEVAILRSSFNPTNSLAATAPPALPPLDPKTKEEKMRQLEAMAPLNEVLKYGFEQLILEEPERVAAYLVRWTM